MKKLTNTLYMIIAVLAIVASQSATAQLHTTSSASLATEPTAVAPAATVAAPTHSSVAHYGYKSSHDYSLSTRNGVGTSYRVIPSLGKAPQISGASAGSLTGFGTASNTTSRVVGSVSLSGSSVNNSVAGGEGEWVPDGSPFPGGVVPVGSATLPLLLMLFAYAAFLAVRKARKEA